MHVNLQSPWMQKLLPTMLPPTEWATPAALRSPVPEGYGGLPDQQQLDEANAQLDEACAQLMRANAEIVRLQGQQTAAADRWSAAQAKQVGRDAANTAMQDRRPVFPPCNTFGDQFRPTPQPQQLQRHPPPGLTQRDVLLEQIRAAVSRNALAATGCEADRIPIGAFPSQSDYRGWRKALEATVISASPSPLMAASFIAAVTDQSVNFGQLPVGTATPFATLDAKLYSAILHSCATKSTEQTARISVALEDHVAPGCGRQALRVVDEDYQQSGPRRRQVVLSQLTSAAKPIHSMGEVESTLTKLKNHLLELQGSPGRPSDGFVLYLLRQCFGPVRGLQSTFAAFDLQGSQSSQTLVSIIEKVALEFRLNKPATSDKTPTSAMASLAPKDPKASLSTAAAAYRGGGKSGGAYKGGGKGGGKAFHGNCFVCGKANHMAKDCRQRSANPANTGTTPKKCNFCGRTGHTKEGCYRNPESLGYKPKFGTARVRTAAKEGRPNCD